MAVGCIFVLVARFDRDAILERGSSCAHVRIIITRSQTYSIIHIGSVTDSDQSNPKKWQTREEAAAPNLEVLAEVRT
jgi:hypothetical protein